MLILLIVSCALGLLGLLAGLMQALCMALRDRSVLPIAIYAIIMLLGCLAILPPLRHLLKRL